MPKGESGDLPRAARWIFGSSLNFFEKQGKDAPRPIRAVEYTRKVITEAMIRDVREKVQAVMKKFGQCGVALSGGAEAAFHARWAVEEKSNTSCSGKWVVVDVDLMTCFGQFEWKSIRQA
jgi:hypothetical protein